MIVSSKKKGSAVVELKSVASAVSVFYHLTLKGFYTFSKLKVIYHTCQIVIIKTTFSGVQYVKNIVVFGKVFVSNSLCWINGFSVLCSVGILHSWEGNLDLAVLNKGHSHS